MLYSLLDAIEAFINAIFKALQDLLNFLGIGVTIPPVDLTNNNQ